MDLDREARPGGPIWTRDRGAVAQLGERRVRNAEVGGSIPLGSTTPGKSGESGTGFLFFLFDSPSVPSAYATVEKEKKPVPDFR